VTPVGVEIDCRGMVCPGPIIAVAKALPGIDVGELLAVVADDPAARHDVPAWCRMRAQEYVGEELADDGLPRYVVRRLS
jgi:tRNA 2-thiouridine synthesizing protein A